MCPAERGVDDPQQGVLLLAELPTEPVHGQRHLPALHDELVPRNGAQAVGPPGAPLHESSAPEQPLQPLWKDLRERLLPGQEGRRPLRLRSPPADDVRHCLPQTRLFVGLCPRRPVPEGIEEARSE